MAMVIILFWVNISFAKETPSVYIPDDLKPWKQWVLHNKDNEFCPFEYNNLKNKHCSWLSTINLDLSNDSGKFSIQGILFKEQWILIPGQNHCWPVSVFQQKKSLPVIEKQNHPAIFLPEGEFHITGQFLYADLPKAIWIPENTGILSLKLNGKTIHDPFISKDYRLWLRAGNIKNPSDNRIQVRVYRLITDDIPMIMTHCFQLSVSGQSREEFFQQVLPETSMLMNIQSPLPIQIEQKKHLRIQVQPGEFEILITTRFYKPVHQLIPDFLLKKSEIWSFKAQTQLRMVKLMNINGIDPKTSGVPQQWQHYPAYQISSIPIIFQEQRRGDPEPPPDQLVLDRKLWLDFDGKGYSIQDTIRGMIHQNWRLNMKKNIHLGRVSFSGEDQLITLHDNQSGIEIRTGQLNMTAESRYTDSIKKLPAIGWDHSMNTVQASLNLPPGWRLFSASGVDTITGSWFERWRLLDFFIALIIVMAIYHLKNIQWAILALITMILTFHEPSAPQLTWLHLLAVIALLRIVPEGRFQSLIQLWFVCAVVLFSVFVVPFMMHQIRSGLFPQLERHTYPQMSESPNITRQMASPKSKKLEYNNVAGSFSSMSQSKAQLFSGTENQSTRDAVVQTGPGLPGWTWQSVQLKWNGPVDTSQMVNLWLISPSVNGFLSVLRVIMVAVLLMGIGTYRPFLPQL